jgi:hypothetical protein
MIFTEGTEVIYKSVFGVVAFASEKSISILVSKGRHPSQDVRVVVHQSDFKNVVLADEK